MTTRPILLPLFVGRVDFETNQINVLHVEVNIRPMNSKINVAQYKLRVDLLFIRNTGNYTLEDLHRQYTKYTHKRIKHILL